jgi:HEAT repeat protein
LSTRLEAAEGLAAHGDLSGLPVLQKLTEDRSFLKQVGDMALSQYHRPEDLRIAVAGSLADMDRTEGVDILLELLANKSDEVRTAAAYALGRMKNPRAIGGLSRGLGVDYGKQGARERSPVVRAHLLRMALLHFGTHEETRAMLARAAEAEYLSVKFLALVASRG